MSDYKVSEGNYWKPKEKGEQLEGLLINKEDHVGMNDSWLYTIEELETNDVKQVWGTTVLDMRMLPIKIGQQVRITYEGLGEKGKGGKQAPHIWKVEYKDADIQSASEKDFDVPDSV